MSLLCTFKDTLRFLTLVKQKFDRRTKGLEWFHDKWCREKAAYQMFVISLLVLDQKDFDVANEFWLSFLHIYMLQCWLFMVWQTVINNFCYALKVIWYMRRNLKLDIAINHVCYWLFLLSVHWNKVRKTARIRNRYNQVPHLPQDTKLESNIITINITNKILSRLGDHKAAMNRRESMTNTRHK